MWENPLFLFLCLLLPSHSPSLVPAPAPRLVIPQKSLPLQSPLTAEPLSARPSRETSSPQRAGRQPDSDTYRKGQGARGMPAQPAPTHAPLGGFTPGCSPARHNPGLGGTSRGGGRTHLPGHAWPWSWQQSPARRHPPSQ